MKYVFLVIFVLMCSVGKAQFSENNAIYLSNSGIIGNYFGLSSSLTYIYKENFIMEVGVMGLAKKPMDRPADFNGGLLSTFTLGIATPRNYVFSYQLLFGKSFNLTPEGNQRINLKAGPTWSNTQRPYNWQPISGSGIVAGNYSYEYQDNSGPGLIIRPTFEMPITQVLGFGIGTYYHFHRHSVNVGVELSVMMGLLRKKHQYEKNQKNFSF